MKFLFPLLMLFTTTAFAANGGPKNLKAVDFCFAPESVQIDPAIEAVTTRLQDDVYQKVLTKLQAYRLPLTPCAQADNELHIQIDGFKTSSGNYVYNVVAEVADYVLKPGMVIVWSAGTYGTTGTAGQPMNRLFSDVFSDLMDSFAADYAKANP